MGSISPPLALPAEKSSLEAGSNFARRGGEEAGLPAKRLDELALVVEEIFMNVVQHAYPPGAAGTIVVSWAVPGPGHLEVEIADEGIAFNPLDRPPPDVAASLAQRPVGGLGVFLTRQFTDSIHYVREDGWNRVRFALLAGAARSRE